MLGPVESDRARARLGQTARAVCMLPTWGLPETSKLSVALSVMGPGPSAKVPPPLPSWSVPALMVVVPKELLPPRISVPVSILVRLPSLHAAVEGQGRAAGHVDGAAGIAQADMRLPRAWKVAVVASVPPLMVSSLGSPRLSSAAMLDRAGVYCGPFAVAVGPGEDGRTRPGLGHAAPAADHVGDGGAAGEVEDQRHRR